MKTNHLFTAFLALLLPLVSLCKEHRHADTSNLRKKTKSISEEISKPSFLDLFSAKLTDKKMKIVAGLVSSLCDDSPPDGFELTETDYVSDEMEGRLATTSYFCSAEAVGFLVSAATTAITEATSTDTATMTLSFVEEEEWPKFLCAAIGCHPFDVRFPGFPGIIHRNPYWITIPDCSKGPC